MQVILARGEGIKFVRDMERGNQAITGFIRGSGSEFSCSVYFEVNNELVKELYQPYCIPQTVAEIVIPMEEWTAAPYAGHPVSTISDMESLTSLVEITVMPDLDLMRDLKGLNQIFNIERPDFLRKQFLKRSYIMSFTSLIVAYLACNPQFEALLRQYCEQYEQSTNEPHVRMLQLVEDLRKIPVSAA